MSHSVCPIVALVGRPNVGKSTLFNRLTRSNRAIVDPTPGVTRDRAYEVVRWEDRDVILVDTGGIEPAAGDDFSAQVTGQTRQAVAEADLVVLILDGREGALPQDHRIAGELRRTGKPLLVAVNKIDGPEMEEAGLGACYELGIGELVPISAEHGYGIRSLLETLRSRLPAAGTEPPLPAATIRVACVGRPNVGKSSLVNRLLGEERMIVSQVPGTTRDSVDTLLVRDEQAYLLVDTAGIRRRGKVQEKLEKFSVLKSLQSLARADIALVLLDAGEGITDQDTRVIGHALERGRALIILINKWDLLRNDPAGQRRLRDELDRQTAFVDYVPRLFISALTGKGVGEILPAVQKVFRQFNAHFGTGPLNRLLKEAVAAHSPPLHQGRRLRLYYTTQTDTRPPTFTVFANQPDGIHFSYHRFLVNRFREGLGLSDCPVRVLLRERPRRQRP
ncbi:MAG: ribosome biogenesis GTPase Der [Thermodesulfobacteriota bacterium]